jgi:hypothetical protein
MRDLVLAARLLRRSPIFTAAAVLTFALGIGVNTAVFSVVNAVLLRPLPVRAGDRLVVVATQWMDTTALRPVSYRDLQDYRFGSRGVFEDIAGYSAGFVGLSADGRPAERALVMWVTGNYFSMLDLRPALGRLIRDNKGGADRSDSVVVLGYDAWQRRFGGDAGVLGNIVRIDGHPCTIVGVAPRGFLGTFAFSDAELLSGSVERLLSRFFPRPPRSRRRAPRPSLGISVDRARDPRTAERTGDAFSIQVLGDLLG